jgi:tRNA(Met) C34 N-acetyltransferase TmcA
MNLPDYVEVDYERLESGVNISHLFVDREHRREGRASKTLDILMSKFRQEGYDYVVVNMGGGESAQNFLRLNGFDIVEVKGEHVTAEIEL